MDGIAYTSPQPPGSDLFRSYTVRFGTRGMEANDGCNSIGGDATLTADTVRITGDVWSTAVDCTESALRGAYQRMLVKGSSIAWKTAAGRLTLTNADGDVFEYEPWPTGYPSDRKGEKHTTTAEQKVDGVPFRIYAMEPIGGDQCLTMEFNPPARIPWEPISACRDDLAAQYVVNPTDFATGHLPSGTGVLFSAVPNGSTSRIVYRPRGGGPGVEFTLVPLPGTTFQAFYGFIEHPGRGSTVTFYDAKGKPYHDTWKVYW